MSRPWKPTGQALALEYSQILDSRGKGEVVFLWWLVPQIAQQTQSRELLDKYIIIGLAHANTRTGGIVAFEPIEPIEPPLLSGADGHPLKPLSENDLPPAVAGVLATLGGVLRQALGPMGKGVHWFVFDGDGVHSCGKGELLVAFAHETYSYKTPIPGCAQQ